MKRLLGSFGAGLFVALAAAFLLTRRTTHRVNRSEVLPDAERLANEMRDAFMPGKVNTGLLSSELLDLNSCSVQDLLGIDGLDADWALRIVEARPYRNKMDLLSRMVVPMDVFHAISERVVIAKPDEGVKIA
jgi:DNA uptake protein ComE-like DNA-binding protein